MDLKPFKKEDIVQIYKPSEKYKTISWQLTKWCNYNCPYCIQKFQGSEESEFRFPTLEKLYSSGVKLNKLLDEQNDNFQVEFIGGEVTYLPIEKIIECCLISEKIYKFKLFSNMSRELSWWKQFVELLQKRNTKLNVVASIHLTEIKDWEKFVEKVLFLDYEKRTKKEIVNITVNVACVVDNDNIDEYIKKVDDLIQRGFSGAIKFMVKRMPDNKTVELTNENKEKIKKYYQESDSRFCIELKDGVYTNVNKTEIVNNYNCNFKGFNCISCKFRYTMNDELVINSCRKSTTKIDKIESKPTKCKKDVCSLCNLEKIWCGKSKS